MLDDTTKLPLIVDILYSDIGRAEQIARSEVHRIGAGALHGNTKQAELYSDWNKTAASPPTAIRPAIRPARPASLASSEAPRSILELTLGKLVVALWLIVAVGFGWAMFGASKSPEPSRWDLVGFSASATGHAARAIQDVRVGDRVLGENPLPDDVEQGFAVPEPDGWRKLSLRHIKPDGHGLDVELLRPLDWLAETGAEVGGTIRLQVPELGIDGPASVLSIGACPAIRPGPGHVVTGTFTHEPSSDLIDVRVEGEPAPIGCTPNHPFWSETRQEFVQAIELEPGEEVHTAARGIAAVASVTPRPVTERVYNLEVQGQHVYQVGASGVLVHNGGQKYLAGGPEPEIPGPPPPRGTLPRKPNGDFIPDSEATGAHTVLGQRLRPSGSEPPYRQGATFDSEGSFLGRTDVTDHLRPGHDNPHFHPATSPNSVGPGQPILPLPTGNR